MTALLRTVRKQQGLTLEALAERTNLTKSYLSKIERQRSIPSIAVAMKIARALDVDVGQLFSDDPAQTKITVERAAPEEAETLRYRTIAAGMLGKSMSPFIVYPTAEFDDDVHRQHAGQEFVFVHSGTVELSFGDQTITMNTGDCAYFDADTTHKIRSRGSEPARVVVVAHNDPELSNRTSGSTPGDSPY